MKVTKRYCDICGDEIPNNVHLEISIIGYISMNSNYNVEIDVCRPCGVDFLDKYYKLITDNKNKKCANLLRTYGACVESD